MKLSERLRQMREERAAPDSNRKQPRDLSPEVTDITQTPAQHGTLTSKRKPWRKRTPK